MSEEREPRWVYGYGATKHIGAPEGGDVGLCGAQGGYPLIASHRPVCKRCAKKAAALEPEGKPE